MPQDQMPLPAGATVQDVYGDRYRVEQLLGKGGFGAVYLVRDRHITEHLFALKELIEPSGHDHERLIFECELLKRLDHRALPRVYHIFENEGLKRVYLLMEYIQGRNLEDLREEQPEKRFSLKVALAIMTPIVDALTYLHTQNPPIVHRDIKPDNIIVPVGGEAVLVDFGTAKEFISDGTTTVFRHGSPGYAPIEQYSPGSRTNQRTDVYGLGATLYTLLTGVTPIDAIARIMAEEGKDPLKPAHEVVPAIPKPVSDAIEYALSINSTHRFASVSDFWEALHDDTFVLPSTTPLPETPLPAPYEIDKSSGTPLLLPGPKQVPFLKKKKVRVFSLILLILVVLGLGALGISLFATYHTSTHSVPRPTTTHTLQATATSVPTTVTPTSIYPPIAMSYAGSIKDIGVANTETPMYLSQVSENPQNGEIRGHFQGLGLTGTFTGTVNVKGAIHFVVNFGAGTLVCDGSIKVGGDIQGTFQGFGADGNKQGEYGPFYGHPNS